MTVAFSIIAAIDYENDAWPAKIRGNETRIMFWTPCIVKSIPRLHRENRKIKCVGFNKHW